MRINHTFIIFIYNATNLRISTFLFIVFLNKVQVSKLHCILFYYSFLLSFLFYNTLSKMDNLHNLILLFSNVIKKLNLDLSISFERKRKISISDILHFLINYY